jgi:hypothetical protein
MSNTSGLKLIEPNPTNWDNYSGSGWMRPPDARDGDGRFIQYYGQVPNEITEEVNDAGYRVYLLDPIKLVKNGVGVDGYELRFCRASLKQFQNSKVGRSMAGDLIRAAGVLAKPQVTREYDAAMKQVKGKIIPLTLDWEARNKDTGEQIRGFYAFPIDPETGTRKAILHQGDQYHVLNEKGQPIEGEFETVKSEVLFANARLRFFATPKAKTA